MRLGYLSQPGFCHCLPRAFNEAEAHTPRIPLVWRWRSGLGI